MNIVGIGSGKGKSISRIFSCSIIMLVPLSHTPPAAAENCTHSCTIALYARRTCAENDSATKRARIVRSESFMLFLARHRNCAKMHSVDVWRLACTTTISMARTTTIAVLRIKQQLQSSYSSYVRIIHDLSQQIHKKRDFVEAAAKWKKEKSLKLYSYSYGTHFFLSAS